MGSEGIASSAGGWARTCRPVHGHRGAIPFEPHVRYVSADMRSVALAISFMAATSLVATPSAGHAQETALATLRAAARSGAPQEQLALGRALRRAGRFAEAATTLRRAVRGTGRADALWEIARVRFDEGNFRASEAACRALPAGHGPRDPAGVLRSVCMGRAYLVWQRAALADREIAAAQAIDPSNAELGLLTADTNRLRNNVPTAEAAYRAAIAALPARTEPHLGLALLYETAQRFDEAQAEYRRAVDLDANDPAAALALGRFLLTRRNDATGALPLLRRATQDRPSWPEALVALGDAQLTSGAVAEALRSYQEAAQVLPAQPGAQSGLGRARVRSNQIAEAEAPLRAAIAQVTNDADAHMALAEVLSRTNRQDEAIEEWNRAIDLLPNDASPRLHAAELAHTMGQNSLARAYLDRILSDDGQHAPALLLRADIAFEENDRVHARQLYQSALGGHGEIDRNRAQARLREMDAPQGRTRRR